MTTMAASTEVLPTGTWTADSAHSRAEFALEYMGGTFRGTFSPLEARLEVADDGSASLSGSARAEDVHVQDEGLEAHLLSPEFFDSERTPVLEFSSTEIRRTGNDLVVTGELTVRGATQPVELHGTINGPLQDAYGRERVVLSLSTEVDRTGFGLNWNAPLPTGEPALATQTALSAELFLVKA
jgi:polyisoprenoid-binding protein YceI